MNNIKNKLRTAFIIALLIVTANLRNVDAQNTFFSISELHFSTSIDSTENGSNTLVFFSMKISDNTLASIVNIEMAEVMHDFTLHKEQGVFISENGINYIEVDGLQHVIYDKYVTFSFKVPNDIIENWKFTRVYVDLHSGEESKYLYHRW